MKSLAPHRPFYTLFATHHHSILITIIVVMGNLNDYSFMKKIFSSSSTLDIITIRSSEDYNYHSDNISTSLLPFFLLSPPFLWSVANLDLVGCNWRCLCKWRWSILAIWDGWKCWRGEEVKWSLKCSKMDAKGWKGVKKEIESFKAERTLNETLVMFTYCLFWQVTFSSSFSVTFLIE